MRRLGIMPIWAREDFVLPALEQARDMLAVDQLAVTVCCMHEHLRKFEDSSEAFVREFARGNPELVTYVVPPKSFEVRWEVAMSQVLNQLLCALKPEENDIVWLLDVDEFYTHEAADEISAWIDSHPDFGSLRLHSWLIGPDFEHYVMHGHTRIHRHWEGRMFIPTSYYGPLEVCKEAPIILQKHPMFHYSMCCPWEMKERFWFVERGLPTPKEQMKKVKWAQNVYRRYRVDQEEAGMQLNQEIIGHHGFWFDDNVIEREGGGLFFYDGPHPTYIENHGLPRKIGDFRSYFPLYKARLPLQSLKGKRGLHGIEIGVSRGFHAWGILNDLDIEQLTLIDPYRRYPSKPPASCMRITTEELEAHFQEANNLLGPWSDEVVFIRQTSEHAAAKIQDESQDFVYVDGNHSYEFVKKDLELYWPKIKSGGLLAGHDYNYWAVKKAANEFADSMGLSLQTGGENNFVIIKPELSVVDPEEESENELVQPLRTPFLPLEKLDGLIGAEIGVELGLNAESLLAHLDFEKLVLVDPYRAYMGRGGPFSQGKVDAWLEEAKQRLRPYDKGQIDFLKMTSEDAASAILDDILDFVYIDGNHVYKDVQKDIQLWSKKVSPGGLIAGHDYYEDEPGVIRAVEEFARQNGYHIAVDKDWNWWTVKDTSWEPPEEYRLGPKIVEGQLEPTTRAGSLPLIAGPFMGELGYEIMVWVPTVRALAEAHNGPVIVVTENGHECLYEDFADEIIVHDLNVGPDRYTFNTRSDDFVTYCLQSDTNRKKYGPVLSEIRKVIQHRAKGPFLLCEPGPWILSSRKRYLELEKEESE